MGAAALRFKILPRFPDFAAWQQDAGS